MLSADITILYVANPIQSAKFYTELLNVQPVEAGPTFALFIIGGFKLGLWSRYTVEPSVAHASPGSAGEILFTVKQRDRVDALYNELGLRGVTMIHKPSSLDFGYAFTAIDLDGHRIRIGCMGE